MARLPCRKTPSTEYMPKKFSDVAIERVPSLCNRISSFQSKLTIAHYAHGTITDYCHALYKAVVYIGKLPDDFTQDDVDAYLQSMLNRKPIPAEAQFKHFCLWSEVLSADNGLHGVARAVTAKIRREKKLPPHTLIPAGHAPARCVQPVSKTLLSVIYDCGLRAFEACTLSGMTSIWTASRCTSGRARAARTALCPSVPETLVVLKAYRKNYPSKNCIFKKFGKDAPITQGFIRARLKEGLVNAGLDMSLTTPLPALSVCHPSA